LRMVTRHSRTGIKATAVGLLVAAIAASCAIPEPTPPPADWNTYTNRWYGYKLSYPPDASIVETIGGASTVIYLHGGTEPFASSDQFVLIAAFRSTDECPPARQAGEAQARTGPIRIGQLEFVVREGEAGGSGQSTTWEAYATQQAGRCVSLTYSERFADQVIFEPSQTTTASEVGHTQLEGILASFRWAELE